MSACVLITLAPSPPTHQSSDLHKVSHGDNQALEEIFCNQLCTSITLGGICVSCVRVREGTVAHVSLEMQSSFLVLSEHLSPASGRVLRAPRLRFSINSLQGGENTCNHPCALPVPWQTRPSKESRSALLAFESFSVF